MSQIGGLKLFEIPKGKRWIDELQNDINAWDKAANGGRVEVTQAITVTNPDGKHALLITYKNR